MNKNLQNLIILIHISVTREGSIITLNISGLEPLRPWKVFLFFFFFFQMRDHEVSYHHSEHTSVLCLKTEQFSTGKLYSVICGDLNRRKSKKEGIYVIHIADPLCCTAETNTTLESNYTPVKIFPKRESNAQKKTEEKALKILTMFVFNCHNCGLILVFSVYFSILS